MKNIIYLLLVSSLVYSQCDYSSEIPCNLNEDCEWIEDIEYGSCSGLSQTQCNSGDAYGNCEWECIQYGWWYDWCYTYGCTGGTYEIDNGSCEEVPYELGDINGDLSINVLDVVETVNLIIDGGYNIAADIDSNGVVNVLDIIQLINIIIDRS